MSPTADWPKFETDFNFLVIDKMILNAAKLFYAYAMAMQWLCNCTCFCYIEETNFLVKNGFEQQIANSDIESSHGDEKESTSNTSTQSTAHKADIRVKYP